MEVKKKYAYDITQDICNKFIETKFSVGLWFGCDAGYDKTQSIPNNSNSSIDLIAKRSFLRVIDFLYILTRQLDK